MKAWLLFIAPLALFVALVAFFAHGSPTAAQKVAKAEYAKQAKLPQRGAKIVSVTCQAAKASLPHIYYCQFRATQANGKKLCVEDAVHSFRAKLDEFSYPWYCGQKRPTLQPYPGDTPTRAKA